jgi:hypothetical protein
MNLVRQLSILAFAAGLVACASTPTTGTPAPQVAAAAETPAPATATDEAATNPFPGTTMRTGPDGATLYCRKEVATGDRIAKEVCYSELAMRQLAEGQKDRLERMRETSTYAIGGT